MCFLTTVYVYQLKTQTPWDSDYESKNNFEDQYTANIFIDKNTIFQLCPDFQNTSAVEV